MDFEKEGKELAWGFCDNEDSRDHPCASCVYRAEVFAQALRRAYEKGKKDGWKSGWNNCIKLGGVEAP